MAMQSKGLDYYPVKVNYWKDPKIRILRIEIDPLAPQVYLQLLAEIYSNGYYLEWNKMNIYSIVEDYNVQIEYLNKIIDVCTEIGLFDPELFNKYNILTSKKIQDVYLDALKHRRNIDLYNEYLLLNFKEIYEKIVRDRLNINILSLDGKKCATLYKSLDFNGDSLFDMSFETLVQSTRSDQINKKSDQNPKKSDIFDKREESKREESKREESESKNSDRSDTHTHDTFFQKWINTKSLHLKKYTLTEDQEQDLLRKVDRITLIQIASELDDKIETGYKVGKLHTALNKFIDQYLRNRK